MYKTKTLRTDIRGLMTSALDAAGLTGYEVTANRNRRGSERYVVFELQDLPSIDERNSIDLEINVIGPDSEADTVELAADVLISALDRAVIINNNFGFYIFKENSSPVDGSDPHTARYTLNLEVRMYERSSTL